MVVQWLVILGLVIIPFAHIEHIVDQSSFKANIAIGLAMAIAFYALFHKGLKFPFNKWVLFLLGSMLLSTFFVPPTGLVVGMVNGNSPFVYTNINIDNLWNYQPILTAILINQETG